MKKITYILVMNLREFIDYASAYVNGDYSNPGLAIDAFEESAEEVLS